jgi:hypothetical protein
MSTLIDSHQLRLVVRTKIDETSYWPYVYYNANTIYILFMSATFILLFLRLNLRRRRRQHKYDLR